MKKVFKMQHLQKIKIKKNKILRRFKTKNKIKFFKNFKIKNKINIKKNKILKKFKI